MSVRVDDEITFRFGGPASQEDDAQSLDTNPTIADDQASVVSGLSQHDIEVLQNPAPIDPNQAPQHPVPPPVPQQPVLAQINRNPAPNLQELFNMNDFRSMMREELANMNFNNSAAQKVEPIHTQSAAQQDMSLRHVPNPTDNIF